MFDHVQLHHHVCHDVVMCSVSYLWTQVMQVYTPLFGGTVLVLVIFSVTAFLPIHMETRFIVLHWKT